MGYECDINNMVEKFKDCLKWIINLNNTGVITNTTAIDKAKELFREFDVEMHMNHTIKMLKSFMHSMVAKVDDVFSPEARTELIKRSVHVAKPYFLSGAALLLILLFFRGRGGGSGGARMMRAPGRNHIKIPRASFEENPRAYFRNLRG